MPCAIDHVILLLQFLQHWFLLIPSFEYPMNNILGSFQRIWYTIILFGIQIVMVVGPRKDPVLSMFSIIIQQYAR